MNYNIRQLGTFVAVLAVLYATPISAEQPPLTSNRGADTKTLPPKEAAKACLTAAEQMVSNGYRKEAIALYERARQLDPSQTHVSRYLAVLYDEIGADREAIVEYDRALQHTPKDANLLNDFGYFYSHRGDMPRAERWFRVAIAQAPKHERAWVNLGLTLAQQGRYQESFEAFSQVMSPAAAHSNVGMLLAKRGMRDDAIRAFRQALTLEPGLKQPRAALACLESAQQPPQAPRIASAPAAPVR